LAGYFFEDVIEGALRSPWIVALMLAAVGFFFIIVEKIYQAKLEDYQAIGFKRCLVIGFAQALALIPGTSRSGITIICGMALGVKRQEAVKFSFLLSIPIIFGAVIVKISDFSIIEALSRPVLPLAFLSAFLSGFFSIKYLIKYAENHRLNAFAYYRFLLALIIIINLFFF
jgi:undecaprenyl-diphosphatase